MKLYLAFVLLALNFGASNSSTAQAHKFGVEDLKYYPQYTTEGSEYSGYAADLFTAFSNYSNLQIEINPTPVKRLFLDFFSGEVAFKYPDNPYWGFSEERESLGVVYSDPVVEYIDGCMVLPSEAGKGAETIKVLGTVRGFTPFDYLDKIESGEITLSENSSFTGLLRQAMRKRIDCAYINISVARYQLKEVLDQVGGLVFDPSLPHTRSAYLLSSIEHPQVIDQFNNFLNENADEVYSLRKSYGVLVD